MFTLQLLYDDSSINFWAWVFLRIGWCSGLFIFVRGKLLTWYLEDHYSLVVVTSWHRLNNNIFFFWSAAIVKTQKLDLGLYLTKKSSEELAGNMTKLISIMAFLQKKTSKSLCWTLQLTAMLIFLLISIFYRGEWNQIQITSFIY